MASSKNDLMNAFLALEEEKEIPKEVIIAALEDAMKAAYKKNYDQETNVEVKFNEKTGNMDVRQVKIVVDDSDFENENTEITLTDALAINRAYELGDEIRFDITPDNFGRLAAQTAKQVILQKLREASREAIYNKFVEYQDEIITAEVERQDERYVYLVLPGNQEAVMKPSDQMENEKYRMGDRIKVLISEVKRENKGPQIFVSRTHPDLVKRLFEQEVPEVYDGIVEIMSISREPGDRSKIAVRSLDADLDPVGTLVGPRGARVQAVVNELGGENMDIIEWVDDAAEYIANSLNPSEVADVVFDPEDDKIVTVIVPDNQLSLAIGKRGQNARLAARLTGFKIDIKSESEADEFLAEYNAKLARLQEAQEAQMNLAEDEELMKDLDLDSFSSDNN